jgi:DNA mismatch repair protein MutS
MKIPSSEGATPAMAQWFSLKGEQPSALLFFRMGDFYELFFEDAKLASAALDIQMAHRGEHLGKPIPMCGVPFHAADSYLSKLIRCGFRVAIAEQMEKPQKNSKLPVKREIVRVITPGTLLEDTLLDSSKPNILLSIKATSYDTIGAAWMDISTGVFETSLLPSNELIALLGRLDPSEILADDKIGLGDWQERRAPWYDVCNLQTSSRLIEEVFAVGSTDALGEFSDAEKMAAGIVLSYVSMTQAGRMPRLLPPLPIGKSGFMIMDAATRAGLEISRARDGNIKNSLVSAVNRTLSAPGGRLLLERVNSPIMKVALIADRQERWLWLLNHPESCSALRGFLRQTPDMIRALGRLSLRRSIARDLSLIRDGLRVALDVSKLLCDSSMSQDAILLFSCQQLWEELSRVLNTGDISEGLIASGFDNDLDEHRLLRNDSRQVIAGLQVNYAKSYGVPGLKIRHQQQLGYVIEVPVAYMETLRACSKLQLRQGLVNAARFTHPDLSELDRKITEAADWVSSREEEILKTIADSVMTQAHKVAACAQVLAQLDVDQSAAGLAESGRWCCPQLEEGFAFHVAEGRHPVVEAALSDKGVFVPNDCDLSSERRMMLLTGPNMAGKSTYLRQNALMVILAQAGLPVPAKSARFGIVDRLFSRVGASDDLARGRSTFMVEMTETAAILHQASPHSMVVVDEIGRGTSTMDGLAIAHAVLEALHSDNKCRTIFATHFHELAELGSDLPHMTTCTMRVQDWKGGVVFLHEVAQGAVGRSWGVHVARLAGVPDHVVERAANLLNDMENNHSRSHSLVKKNEDAVVVRQEPPCLSISAVEMLLDGLNPDLMSPRQALDALYHLKMAQIKVKQ